MAQAVGYNSFFAVGEETTWGTSVARTDFAPLIEDGMKAVNERIHSASFRELYQKTRSPGKLGAEGGVGVEMSYSDKAVWLLMKHLFGAVATQPNVPVAGAYTHTFTLADAPLAGLSLEIHRDAASAFLYAGYKVNEGKFTAEMDAYIKANFTGAAKQESLVAASAASYAAARYAYFNEIAATWGGVTKQLQKFDFSLNKGLKLDKRVLGSRTILDPTQDKQREVSGTMSMFFEALAEYNDFIAQTERALIVTCTTAEFITGTTPFKITFTFNGVELTGETPKVDGRGSLSINMPFRAYETATKKPVECALQTNLATV